jgi:hypothetical protein
MKIFIDTQETIEARKGTSSEKLAILKLALMQFDKTRSLSKATEICEYLINNLDMPKNVKVRRG